MKKYVVGSEKELLELIDCVYQSCHQDARELLVEMESLGFMLDDTQTDEETLHELIELVMRTIQYDPCGVPEPMIEAVNAWSLCADQ